MLAVKSNEERIQSSCIVYGSALCSLRNTNSINSSLLACRPNSRHRCVDLPSIYIYMSLVSLGKFERYVLFYHLFSVVVIRKIFFFRFAAVSKVH